MARRCAGHSLVTMQRAPRSEPADTHRTSTARATPDTTAAAANVAAAVAHDDPAARPSASPPAPAWTAPTALGFYCAIGRCVRVYGSACASRLGHRGHKRQSSNNSCAFCEHAEKSTSIHGIFNHRNCLLMQTHSGAIAGVRVLHDQAAFRSSMNRSDQHVHVTDSGYLRGSLPPAEWHVTMGFIHRSSRRRIGNCGGPLPDHKKASGANRRPGLSRRRGGTPPGIRADA